MNQNDWRPPIAESAAQIYPSAFPSLNTPYIIDSPYSVKRLVLSGGTTPSRTGLGANTPSSRRQQLVLD